MTLMPVPALAMKHEPLYSWCTWRHFTSMPHHIMFALGSLQAVLVMLLWLAAFGAWLFKFAPIYWRTAAT